MNRVVVAAVAAAAIVGAGVLGWFEVRQTREFRRLLAVGDAALAAGQTSAAVEAYSGAVALRPDSILGWLKRGDTYRRRAEYGPALRDLERAAELSPAAPQPIELLGDVNAALGRHDRAIALYGRYVAIDDRAARVFYKRGLAEYRTGRIPAAIESLQRALSIDRDLTEAHYLLGLCEWESKQPDRAAAALMRAIALNPAFVPAREELAAQELARGRRRDAIEQLEAVAALDARQVDRLIAVARTYARGGRLEAAALTFGRAVERTPDSAPVLLAVARFWLDIAEAEPDSVSIDSAMQALEKASSHGAASPEYLFLRGRAQLLAGNAADAERSLQAATASLPVEPAVFRYLAQAADRLGHRAIASRARASYAALAP